MRGSILKTIFFIICSITITQAENNAPAKIVSNCGPDGTNITFTKSNVSNIEKLWKSTPQDGGFNYLGFHCDKLEGVKPEAVILKDIDFKTGNYICEYALEQSSSARERKKDGVSQEDVFIQDENYARLYRNETCLKDYEKSHKFSDIVKPTENIKSGGDYKSTYIGTQPTKIVKKNSWLWGLVPMGDKTLGKEYVINLKKLDEKQDFLEKESEKHGDPTSKGEKRKIHTNDPTTPPTISELFTATITLDAGYFADNEKGLVDVSTGKINFANDMTTMAKESWGIVFKDRMKPINPMEQIIDGKFWGFYASFIENIRIAEQVVVLMLFFAGFVGLTGQKIAQAGFAQFGDNQSKNELGFARILVGPITSLIIFVAPVVPSGLTIDNRLLKDDNTEKVGIVLGGNTEENKKALEELEAIGGTTVIQSAIQYFVRWGVLIANEFADYALFPYLNYLEYKEGIIMGNTAEMYDEKIKEAKESFLLLQKQYNFYVNSCKAIYGKSDDKESLLLLNPLSGRPPLSLKEITEKSYNESNAKKLYNNFGFHTVDAEFCAKLETDMHKTSQEAISQYAFLESAIQSTIDVFVGKKKSEGESLTKEEKLITQPKTFTNYNNKYKHVNNVKAINDRMVNAQSDVGWMFSAVVPLSHTLFQSASLSSTIQNKQEHSEELIRTSASRQNTVSTGDYQDSTKELSESEPGFLAKVAEYVMPNTMYFLLPKFMDLYKAITEVIDKIGITVLGAIIGYIVGGANPITGGISAIIIGQFFTSITKLLFGKLVTAVSYVVGYLIAIYFYNVFLQTLSLLTVTFMIIFKIALYLIEVLFFFVASPAVVIWAVVSRKSEVMWSYIGKAAVLTITPLLIVLSCYTFIFATEILNTTYGLLSGMIGAIFINSETTITQMMSLISVLSIGNAVMLFVYIIVGYVVIVRFDTWFLDTIGAKASVMNNTAEHFSEQTKRLYSPI